MKPWLKNKFLVRVAGIEPTSQPWEGRILPMYYTRLRWPNGQKSNGADERARTADLCFTKALLCQLSYIGLVVNQARLADYARLFHNLKNSNSQPHCQLLERNHTSKVHPTTSDFAVFVLAYSLMLRKLLLVPLSQKLVLLL